MKDRLVDVNGVRLRVTEAGDRGAPVVVLSHGFPSLGYSWRRVLPVLADAGYHVLALISVAMADRHVRGRSGPMTSPP